MGQRGEVFTCRVPSKSDRRTYFLNVKENRLGDLYLTIVESKEHGDSDFERHQVVLFDEDIPSFEKGMQKVIEFLQRRRAGTKPLPERTTDGGSDRPRRP